MNFNKQTAEMNKQAKAVVGAPKLARRISRAPKTSGIAGEKATTNPASDVSPRGQEARVPETVTVVEARIDVGLGNTLFIRGQGDGLSWDKGQPLACMNASTWVWHSALARDNIVFKLLVNDQVWAKGADLALEPGRKLEVVPAFA